MPRQKCHEEPWTDGTCCPQAPPGLNLWPLDFLHGDRVSPPPFWDPGEVMPLACGFLFVVRVTLHYKRPEVQNQRTWGYNGRKRSQGGRAWEDPVRTSLGIELQVDWRRCISLKTQRAHECVSRFGKILYNFRTAGCVSWLHFGLAVHVRELLEHTFQVFWCFFFH